MQHMCALNASAEYKNSAVLHSTLHDMKCLKQQRRQAIFVISITEMISDMTISSPFPVTPNMRPL